MKSPRVYNIHLAKPIVAQLVVNGVVSYLFIYRLHFMAHNHSQYKKGRVNPTTEKSIIKRRKGREVSPLLTLSTASADAPFSSSSLHLSTELLTSCSAVRPPQPYTTYCQMQADRQTDTFAIMRIHTHKYSRLKIAYLYRARHWDIADTASGVLFLYSQTEPNELQNKTKDTKKPARYNRSMSLALACRSLYKC